ncbi:fasciclin domain-containing protein [Pedobacter sp. MW01-1-1]|uniref:fasciclin domain-containing protein n=1 Tax=Pedobacter sp. MW01-1-1 TaxID=3383027 RepID=UPI003FEF7A76
MKLQNKNKSLLLMLGIALMLFASCKKYYYDTGVHEAKYNGTTMQYMKEKAPFFDSTLTVINLAGMNDVLDKENVTFFAPPSGSVYKSIKRLNNYLKFNGKDTVSQLKQIKPEVWKSVLSQYIFKGVNLLKDYPQKDTLSYLTYPGQNYTSYGGRIMNVGAIFNDAAGVKYAGYRQLFLSYIPDLSNPQVALQNNPVATSDIQTTNGVIHVLTKVKHNFGFNTDTFIDQVVASGILPPTL